MKQITKTINLLKFLKTAFSKEKVETYLKNIEKLNSLADAVDSVGKIVKDNTDVLCDVYECDSLNTEVIKEIAKNQQAYSFIALLKDGYNNKKEKHVFFLQFLDADKKAVDESKIYWILSDNFDVTLKQEFGNKELLILK